MGKIELDNPGVPDSLYDLFTGEGPECDDFLSRIRAYNSIFSFTSFRGTVDTELANAKKGVFTFRAQGQVYHNLPSLIPSEGRPPAFFQLYFYDTEHEADHRVNVLSENPVERQTVSKLIDMMNSNPYSQLLRSLDDKELDNYQIRLRADPKVDQRVSNKPSCDQVGAIWIEGSDATAPQERDIHVHAQSGELHKLRYYYGCYDSLMYPLLFPLGECGWHQNIMKVRPRILGGEQISQPNVLNNRNFNEVGDIFEHEQEELAAPSVNKVSCREYYSYKLQMRPGERCILFDARRLLHQFIVDMYIKLESTRLNYFRTHQRRIRADLYQGLVDCYRDGEFYCKKMGVRVVLPSSFIGGPRDMKRRYMDALALVGKFGKPDLFITMTCNPEWSEIKEHLKPGQLAQDRPDLSTRVFRAKLQDLKDVIVTKQFFGEVAGHVFVIEFQKRGLPHAHLLVILKAPYKITSPDQFDELVCAEIPDPVRYPTLYESVTRHMMHGPCGDVNRDCPCMRDNKCKNRYPRPFCCETTQGKDSYPIYRRRENGRYVTVKNVELDNGWVVPYNPYLLSRFDCHINVEICSGIRAVKYLYKYIYKGHDKVCVKLEYTDGDIVIDEIKQFRDARWVAAPEAVWRIFGFALHDIYPAIINLQLHLEDQQSVTFKESDNIEYVLSNELLRKTMLTEFFTYCREHPDETDHLYSEFPENFTWNGQRKVWTARKNKRVVGRIFAANPSEGERYFLRMLLCHVRSPHSFKDLMTVNNELCSSYKEAAEKCGLLQSDNWITECFEDAVSFQMPNSLHRMFATILVYCEPANVEILWNRFYEDLSEDFMRIENLTAEEVLRRTLMSVDYFLDSMGKCIGDYNLPSIPGLNGQGSNKQKREIQDEYDIITPEHDMNLAASLNSEQAIAYDMILQSVNAKVPSIYFVDGPGGTGKTFLYRALLATVRKNGGIALATATSGVAAAIMPGGRTAHSRFKIVLDGDPGGMCGIKRQSGLCQLIKSAELIIWDEAPMAKRWDIESVDRTLRDILENDDPFGGKIVVFGGDFRQVLPVVHRATRSQTIDASLVSSYLWPLMRKLELTLNMRAKLDPHFSEFLLRVGNGTEPELEDGRIKITNEMCIPEVKDVSIEDQLIAEVYPDLENNSTCFEYMTNRGVLACRNHTVDMLNAKMIAKFPGSEWRYTSYDKAIDDKHNYYPQEFLNTLTPNGLPPHELILKKNSPIMLLRNLSPPEGLCNGTRLICRGFRKNLIDAEITFGQHAGKRVLLHRIPLQPAKNECFPFQFERMQFPVRLCFAMTINKAQGQTIPNVGIYLPQDVFSHGQLYVALSRGMSMETTKVFITKKKKEKLEGSFTRNIVYKEVLTLND